MMHQKLFRTLVPGLVVIGFESVIIFLLPIEKRSAWIYAINQRVT